MALNICHVFLFLFFHHQDDREHCAAEQGEVSYLTVLCLRKLLRFIIIIPFGLL